MFFCHPKRNEIIVKSCLPKVFLPETFEFKFVFVWTKKIRMCISQNARLHSFLVAQRFTLVVVFGFLPQHFGKWCDLWMVLCHSEFYKFMLSGMDTQRWWGPSHPTYCNKICFNFLHSQVVGTHLVKLSLPYVFHAVCFSFLHFYYWLHLITIIT